MRERDRERLTEHKNIVKRRQHKMRNDGVTGREIFTQDLRQGVEKQTRTQHKGLKTLDLCGKSLCECERVREISTKRKRKIKRSMGERGSETVQKERTRREKRGETGRECEKKRKREKREIQREAEKGREMQMMRDRGETVRLASKRSDWYRE